MNRYNQFIAPVLYFILLAHVAQAQSHAQTQPAFSKALKFSSVTNGFTYELTFPERLNIASFLGISAVISNHGPGVLRLEAYLNNNRWVSSAVYPEPGETKTIEIVIQRTMKEGDKLFPGMRAFPGWAFDEAPFNPAKIEKMTFRVYTKDRASLTISGINFFGELITPKKIAETPDFFPILDKFGQYRHAAWPGKIRNDSDLLQANAAEEEVLQNSPAAPERDRFGGWADGPKLNATGHFRVQKVEGKWWLVDPDGNLFWSDGITGVRFTDKTRTSGRENLFENLPAADEPLGKFYLKERNGTTYNFLQANLYRKYGSQWQQKATRKSLQRLKSWGLNSFGNWSDPNIYMTTENRVPYTVPIDPAWPKADGEDFKFPNVFDPHFPESVKAAVRKLDPRCLTDEYCIGFFIDNELVVRDITRALMRQPVSSKTRLPFCDWLKQKYASVERLNAAWKTTYTDWLQVQALTALPDGAKEDIKSFDLVMIDIYYRTCREELKQAAPHKLYLGSRLHPHYFPDDQTESHIIKIASQYCDVVSFNRYRFSAEDLILPFGIDKPTLIGEFHIGTYDRGLPGMRAVANQSQRADAYYHYIEGALHNPQIVGAHWFHYNDFAFTGIGLKANYQQGFVDICDIPYPEITAAARKIGYQIYNIRAKK